MPRNISDGVAASLSSLETLHINVRHSRQDKNMLPTLMICHRHIVPRKMEIRFWCMIMKKDVFRSQDVFTLHQLFESQNTLQFFADSEHWYADGTFKVCPEIFFQLYSMVSVTEEFFRVCSYFCQIKTKTLTIDYLNSYSNS